MHRHGLRDEIRVLLVHGVLHLLGLDHEKGADDHAEMADAERAIMAALQWQVMDSPCGEAMWSSEAFEGLVVMVYMYCCHQGMPAMAWLRGPSASASSFLSSSPDILVMLRARLRT